MKKYLSVLFVAIFALVLTGCGKADTLTCTGEESGYNETLTITFKGNKVSKIEEVDVYEKEEDAQTAYEWGQLGLLFGDGFKISIDGKKVKSSMDEKVLEAANMKTGSKSEMKEYYEAQGYTCK